MADSKKQSGNVGGTIGLVIGLVSAAAPIVTKIIDKYPAKTEATSSEEQVIVPELCSKKFVLKLEQATELLENCGLKALPVKLSLKDAAPKYKDCLDGQVIASNHKAGSKTKLGETIILQYVTQEVIDESQRIFTESEKRKAAVKEERAAKRSEQIDKAKTTISDVADKAKSGVNNIIHRNDHKKIVEPTLTDDQ